MIKLNGTGPVTALDDKLIQKICATVPRVPILKHVANLLCIPYTTLHHWLTRGNREMTEGINDSIYVSFALQYNRAWSEFLALKLEELGECPKSYGAITWILEKCFREDFEVKSEYVKQLEDYVLNFVKPMMVKGGFEDAGKETTETNQQNQEG